MTPAGTDQRPGGGRGDEWGRRAWALLGVTLLALLVSAGGAGATVHGDGQPQAEGNDTDGPTVGSLTAVDATTMELVLADDSDVDEASIDVGDFQVSPGRLASVEATEDGSDAVVTLELASPVDSDTVAVGFTDDATVTDVGGNRLDAGGVSPEVDGMDGVPPRVAGFDVESAGGTSVNVSLAAHESIGSVLVTLEGPETVRLRRGNFSAVADGTRLNATVAVPAAGDYRVSLDRLGDRHGNTRRTGQRVTVATDDRPPEAVAGIDFGASRGLTVTMDASRSTAEDPVRSITWDLGDGSEATGERVTHRYRPGNYTVNVTVTDDDGDVDTDQVIVTLGREDETDPIGPDPTVSFAANATPGARSAIVDVAGPADEPIRIERGNATDAPIASSHGVALAALTVTFPTDARHGFAVQADDPSTVADVENATDGQALGGLTIVHDVADDAVSNVTAEFTVAGDRLPDDATPEDVSLLRYHNGSWTGLNASLDGTEGPDNGTFRYRASSPGLSRFAVATAPNGTVSRDETETARVTPTPTATPTPTPTEDAGGPSIGVTTATVNRTAVDPGQTVAVSATVTNNGDDVAGYTPGLAVNGTVVDTQVLTVPPGENRTVSLSYVANETGSYRVTVNGTTAGTVTVGGDGGLLASVVGLFGFLPLGLLRAVLTYFGGVLVAAFLGLKSLALLMDY